MALVGTLLADPPHAARPFLLDGQAVVLEDVLSVHPEWEEAIRIHLGAGALEAGPWYVLGDELLVSGEAMVRNLLAGRRVLRRLGASPPPVCYSPDAFGHPAALPTIAQGFGLTVAVLWRGYGGLAWPAGDTVLWRAPDGAELLVWHLPPDGYEYGSALPTDSQEASARWRALREQLLSRSAAGVVLLTNGADHHARQPALDEALAVLSAAAELDGARVRRSSLGAWAGALREAVAHRHASGAPVPIVHGELRDSRGHTWSLQGTFATRSWQKRAVTQTDRLLRTDAEPWLALAWLRGACTSDAALLDVAWRTLLRTMPHDTLCGCSVDAVARALDSRVDAARTQAIGLRDAALDALLARDPATARGVERAEWKPRLVLRNRVCRPRAGVAEVELLTTIGDVAVGPGSATVLQPHASRRPHLRLRPDDVIVQPLSTRLRHARRESPHHYPDDDLAHACRALVWVPASRAVPALGLRVWPLVPPSIETESAPAAAADGMTPATLARVDGTITLENGALRVVVRDGRVTWHDLQRDHTVSDAIFATWQRDVGDTYTAAPRGPVRRLTVTRVRLLARGPLRAAVELRAELLVSHEPVAADLDFVDDAQPQDVGHDDVAQHAPRTAHTRRPRKRLRRIRVMLRLSLDAGAHHVSVVVRAIDHAPDHRLRLVFATGCAGRSILADAAFGPVERWRERPGERLAAPSDARQVARTDADELAHVSETSEHMPTTAPLHRWVAVHAERVAPSRSVALISDGLAEYEAFANGDLAVTLCRATGELSRADLPERPGHAGWPAAVPGAQGPGLLRARFAVRPGGALRAHEVEQCADDVLLPLVGTTWRDAPADTPSDHVIDGIALRGDDVVGSAIMPADDGDGVILRAVNLAAAPRDAAWIVPVRDVEASVVRLDETPVDETPRAGTQPGALVSRVDHVAGRTEISLTLGARAVSSVRLRRAP